MGVRRPDDRGMQGAGPDPEVVDVAAAPGQEGRVFDPLGGWPDETFALDAQDLAPGRRIPTGPSDPSIVAIRASTAEAARPPGGPFAFEIAGSGEAGRCRGVSRLTETSHIRGAASQGAADPAVRRARARKALGDTPE